MQGNKTNSVLFLKDVESNLIEEAVIVVKGNIKILDDKGEKKYLNRKTILKEAELIINNKIEENNINFLNFKIDKLVKINKWLKVANIIMLVLIFILFLA